MILRSLGLASLLFLAASSAFPQQLEFPPPADEAALTGEMPLLAERAIAIYHEDDRDRFLDNLFRMQLVAGRYAEARTTLASLRELRLSANATRLAASTIRDDIYARARELDGNQPFDAAFRQSFREVFASLDDLTACQVISSIGSPLNPYSEQLETLRSDLNKSLDQLHGKTTITLADAVDLIRRYQVAQSLASYQLLTDGLISEDDHRRYVFEEDIPIRTPDGATVAAMVMRPRSPARLPTLLQFTIYVYENPVWKMSDVRLTAAHGYASAMAYTRGKTISPDHPVPYEHDGADADAVIEWIARQSWSDGRVGMFGGSYNGFTQWAAAKHPPRALKAIMDSVSAAPGIDVPMEGNVFLSFVYPWPLYTTTNKTLDQAHYDDHDRWDALNKNWYTSGQAYRSLDRIDGTPNPFFRRWLDHPAYDAFWQAMIPYKEEFAKINIPVLTTTGYYDGGQIGALYYFTEHNKYNRQADHYLLIGPYDHVGAQRIPSNVLAGYEIDPVARIDIVNQLRYQWFDYVFRGGSRPELLKDRVNYEVMGANQWKHASTLEAMGSGRRFYLGAEKSGDDYRLNREKPLADLSISQKVDLTDRTDVNVSGSGLIIDKTLDRRNGIVFVSDPLAQPTEVSGLFSGQIEFVTNKKDFDFNVALYEETADGQYFQLSWYIARASYVRDRSHRNLLTPGKRMQLAFKNGRLTSRLFRNGSRLVAVLSIVKEPDIQINYGTGRDVSDETIADAKTPLEIRWFADSYLDIPISK